MSRHSLLCLTNNCLCSFCTAKTNFPIHEYLDEIVGHDAAVASKDVDMVQHPEAAGTSYRVMESPAQQAGLKQKRPMPGLR